MKTRLRPGSPNSTRGRRKLAAAALLVTAPVLAGCGFNVQTDNVYQPAVGTNARDGDVDILNSVIVQTDEGSGVFVAGLSNNDTDRADAVTGLSGQGLEFATFTTPISAGGYVNLASEEIKGVSVEGKRIRPGNFVTVTVTFKNADPATWRVPVVRRSGPFSSVGPEPTASPTEESTEATGAESGDEGH